MTRSTPSEVKPSRAASTRARRRLLPGFGLTLGYSLFCLSLVVLLPMAVLFWKTATYPAEELWAAVSSARAMASYRLTLGTAF
ncbi:MAG: hypothetical protein KIT83_18625, partial [Bryobacterales bacterium]|nr:hypothetical protein [Bryobacterales bacterium]